MKKIKQFLLTWWVVVITIFVYVGFLGPALMSAASDIAVILNLVLLVLLGCWFYVAARHYFNRNFPSKDKE